MAADLLRACLSDQYDLTPETLELLPRGHDFRANVYRVGGPPGPRLLKVTQGALYEPRYLVPRLLADAGVRGVVAPIPTRAGALWTELAGSTAALYPYVEGRTGLPGMGPGEWTATGALVKQMHATRLPPAVGDVMRRETFDPAPYERWVLDFEAGGAPSRAEDTLTGLLMASWDQHRAVIHGALALLQRLGPVLCGLGLPCVPCHADLHASNLIRGEAGDVFLIDWDDVMLAPKERDFIFVRPPHDAAFFQGYGEGPVDWRVLTYYLWERVVQDLIECAHNVCAPNGLSDSTRGYALQAFRQTFEDNAGANMHAARASAALLPVDVGRPLP